MTLPVPRFLLVDDHALFRTGLSLMLAERWPNAVCLHAASWAQALALAADPTTPQPTLVMLDVHLPDAHGVADLPSLQALLPGCPILLMSGQLEGPALDQARERGAAGFLSKTASARAIVAAVLAAWEGEGRFEAPIASYAPPPSQQALAAAEPWPTYADDGTLSLTTQQRNILRYLGRNTPNKAIARQLGLSEDEVRVTVSWLTEALQATCRQQAYDAAVARGLL